MLCVLCSYNDIVYLYAGREAVIRCQIPQVPDRSRVKTVRPCRSQKHGRPELGEGHAFRGHVRVVIRLTVRDGGVVQQCHLVPNTPGRVEHGQVSGSVHVAHVHPGLAVEGSRVHHQGGQPRSVQPAQFRRSDLRVCGHIG